MVGLVLPSWTGIWLVGGVLLAAALADLALAGGVRGLAFTRSSAASVRLGEPVEVTLTIGNAGRRAVRGVLRDAWPPSAAAIQAMNAPTNIASAVKIDASAPALRWGI